MNVKYSKEKFAACVGEENISEQDNKLEGNLLSLLWDLDRLEALLARVGEVEMDLFRSLCVRRTGLGERLKGNF